MAVDTTRELDEEHGRRAGPGDKAGTEREDVVLRDEGAHRQQPVRARALAHDDARRGG